MNNFFIYEVINEIDDSLIEKANIKPSHHQKNKKRFIHLLQQFLSF